LPEIFSKEITLGKSEVIKEGRDFTIIALGSMVSVCLKAIELLSADGLSGGLVNARFIKPIDQELLENIGRKFKFIFTAEEGIIDSGFGSVVENAISRPVIKLGLPCKFISHGTREILLEKYGLSSGAIADKIKSIICPR
jgi:1-deoxy-D-xylulose-5-phosphate synthase